MNQEQGIANQKLFGNQSAPDGNPENRVNLVPDLCAILLFWLLGTPWVASTVSGL